MPRKPAQSNPATPAEFDGLVGRIAAVSDALRDDALAVVNRSVTARAWITGYYIVEYEQHGRDRAKYGDRILKTLAKRLNGGEFSLASLKNYRAFYLVFPEVFRPLADYLADRFGKGYTASGLLPTVSASGKGYTTRSLSGGSLIVETGKDSARISPEALFNRLSYSHIREIVRLPAAPRPIRARNPRGGRRSK